MMDAEERAAKRRMLIGFLLALTWEEAQKATMLERVNAAGIPQGLARKAGLLSGPDRLLKHVTMAAGQEMLKAAIAIEPAAKADLEAEIGPLGGTVDEGLMENGSAILGVFGVLADRILDVLVPDSEHVDALVRSVGSV